jgi:hypothetical protein
MNSMHASKVLESCRVNAACSGAVEINADAVAAIASEHFVPGSNALTAAIEELYDVRLPLRFESVEEEVNFIALANLVRFGSGFAPAMLAEGSGAEWRGTLALAQFGAIGLHLSGRRLDARRMQGLSAHDVASVFGLPSTCDVPTEVPGCYRQEKSRLWPLAQRIAAALNETGKALVAAGAKDFAAFLRQTIAEESGREGTAERVAATLAFKLPAFSDQHVQRVTGEVTSGGEGAPADGPVLGGAEDPAAGAARAGAPPPVRTTLFHAKAQTLVFDLHRRFSLRARSRAAPDAVGELPEPSEAEAAFAIEDVSSLTARADARLCTLLLALGALRCPEGSHDAASGEASARDGAAALRAAAVECCERIRATAAAAGAVDLVAADVDGVLRGAVARAVGLVGEGEAAEEAAFRDGTFVRALVNEETSAY